MNVKYGKSIKNNKLKKWSNTYLQLMQIKSYNAHKYVESVQINKIYTENIQK